MPPETLPNTPQTPCAEFSPDVALEALTGPGVHSGRPCRLELRRLETGPAGPVFDFPGIPLPLAARELYALPRRATRATVLGADGAIATPEHLLAALLFFSEAPLSVRADAPELPGLDGSALPFRDSLARLFPEAARRPAWREYACGLEWEHTWQGGHIRIRPSARFAVRYSLDRDGLNQTCRLDSAEAAWHTILPARTFAFHREWREAVAGGLMVGAGRDSGLLLAGTEEEYEAVLELNPVWRGGPYPLLNQPEWRVPDEPVRHKILDLLGDLALNGLALPRAEIDIRNGGHHAHHLLLDRLAGLN